jgi:hypothetical protein
VEAKPGEIVTDGRNVMIGAPVVIAVSRPTSDASKPTPDAGVESKNDKQEESKWQ